MLFNVMFIIKPGVPGVLGWEAKEKKAILKGKYHENLLSFQNPKNV